MGKKLLDLATWIKNKGLSCEECRKLAEEGVKEVDCESCEKPSIFEENEIVLKIYSYNPIIPIPMTDGLIMLDLKAVEFLMDVFEVDNREEILTKLQLYHEELTQKKVLKSEK